MSTRDTYDIIVDVEGWTASRGELADLLADLLDGSATRLRPILDVHGAPVASFNDRDAADTAADRLAAAGVDVEVRRRVARKRTLQELTARAEESSSRAAAPPTPSEPVAATPHGDTVKPGWASLAESQESKPIGADASTLVGMPGAAADPALRAAKSASTSGAQPPPLPPARQAIDIGGAAIEVAARPVARTSAPPTGPDAAPPDAPPPAAGGGWQGILGDALQSRLAIDARPDGAESPEPSTGAPASPRAPVTPEGGGSRDADDGTFVAPASDATLDIDASRQAGRVRAAIDGAAPPSPSGGVATNAAAGSSGWAMAGVDVAAREAAPDVSVEVAKPAAVRPVDTGDAARGDTIVFDPNAKPAAADASPAQLAQALGMGVPSPSASAPAPEAALAESVQERAPDPTKGAPAGAAASDDAGSVGDRFVRLERPADAAPAPDISASGSVLWSVLAPGGGFAYIGDPGRGLTYALGAIVGVPWVVGGVRAYRAAAAIERGEEIPERRSDAGARLQYVGAFWGVVLVAIFALDTLVSTLRPTPESPPTAVATPTLDVAPTEANTEPDAGADDAGSEADAAADRARLSQLIRQATAACDGGRYFECRTLADEALAIDDTNRPARLLHVRAVAQGVVVPEPPPEPDAGQPRRRVLSPPR